MVCRDPKSMIFTFLINFNSFSHQILFYIPDKFAFLSPQDRILSAKIYKTCQQSSIIYVSYSHDKSSIILFWFRDPWVLPYHKFLIVLNDCRNSREILMSSSHNLKWWLPVCELGCMWLHVDGCAPLKHHVAVNGCMIMGRCIFKYVCIPLNSCGYMWFLIVVSGCY